LKRTRTNGTLVAQPARGAAEGRSLNAFADAGLAGRLEHVAARDIAELAVATAALDPGTGAESIGVAGGIAAYLGAGSPANGAVGLGFDGAVTHADIEYVEAFFLERGETPVVSVCPLADPSLADVLSERGWAAVEFENVLVRALDCAEHFEPPPAGVTLRAARDRSDLDAWALVAARGFSAPEEPTPAEIRIATAATRRDGARFLFGLVDGAHAGVGQLDIVDGLAWLSADTTLPRFRRRGVQGALQRGRLALGRDAGCRLAVTESSPGSPSLRNLARGGFGVAYPGVDPPYPAPRGAGPPEGSAA